MIYRMMPRSYRVWLGDTMTYAGNKSKGSSFVNKAFILGVMAGLMGFFLMGMSWLAGLVGFIIVFVMLHGMLLLAVQGRARFVEDVLPDALQLMAANCRAGYIPNRALLLSARPEFGPLSEAIKMAGKEMATGMPLDQSLRIIPQKIKSEILGRTMKLIIEGNSAGGQFASLLDETAEDIRRVKAIKSEVAANIVMYSIFIGFAGCVGAPALYALSGHLVTTISSMSERVQMPEEVSGNMPKMMGFSGLSISSDFLFMFSLAAITITTAFGGMIIGLISSGELRTGIKYVPVMVSASLAIFFVARMMITAMFTFVGV